MKKPRIIAIVGPTACGKTSMGIAIAKRVGGEVIAADSRTVYRGMDVGTAKPECDDCAQVCSGVLRDRDRISEHKVPRMSTLEHNSTSITTLFTPQPHIIHNIPHWGIDLVEPNEPFSVSDFQAYADQKIAEICARGNVPILVGGTGLYIRAVIDRPNFAGAAPSAELRAEIETMTDNEILEAIAVLDPDAAAAIDEHNRRRLVRALEILRTNGGTLADHQEFGEPLYDALQIGVSIDREALYARIDQRVDEMIAKGLVDEVRVLMEKYGEDSVAMTGIGYRQIVEFFAKKMSLRDAVLRIKYDSRHYAKRQETWFRRDARIAWVNSERDAIARAEAFLA